MPTIDDLPTELILAIFAFMDPKTMISASSACRQWYKLYSLPEQQYKVAQHRYSVADGPPNDEWPASRRLEALRAHQARWRTLSWAKSHTFNNDTGDQWECFSGVYGRANRFQNCIMFNKAPSVVVNSDESMWSINVPIPIRDFCMDSYQDLVVVMNAENQRSRRDVHFLSMSDGRPHPRAKYPLVSEDISSVWPYDSGCTIEIYGEHVIILFRGYTYPTTGAQRFSSVLIIWNWITGEKMMRLSSSGNNFVDSFCFLSPDHVLVGRRTYPSTPSAQSSLEVYCFGKGLQHINMRRFQLPKLAADASLNYLELLCQAVPTPNHHAWRPFYTSPSNRICMISVYYSNEVSYRWVNYIVFASTFLKTFPNEETNLGIVDPEEFRYISTVPWKDWSLQTRITSWNSERSVYKAVTYGTRIVRLLPAANPGRYRIQICDFNPYARSQIKDALGVNKRETGIIKQKKLDGFGMDLIGRVDEMQRDVKQNEDVATVNYRYIASAPARFPLDSIFAEPIFSALPYLETTTVEDFEVRYVMMDFENIYLLDHDEVQVLSL
ncbi:hypothetical protein PIIN_09288 [Serendipita indica DSM 11827]|uniref:F-box domain-containing protein n=1 Tax=Serendipita indica (strain DSM 11827) TaxID=1109443 RepID=G4TVG0_SERID|nr:hypothetical protein PIIN_09288 [Serendipita indica DSM 11827]